MSDSQNMSDEVRARLRAIPSVNELLAEWPVVKAAGETCDAVVHAAVTAELDEERAAIRAGAAPRSKRDLASAIEWRAHRSALPSLRPAVNATGVVIHTNLGRAPLAESAAKAGAGMTVLSMASAASATARVRYITERRTVAALTCNPNESRHYRIRIPAQPAQSAAAPLNAPARQLGTVPFCRHKRNVPSCRAWDTMVPP